MVDYSKWNNIDVSEDEDDYHPNIDQASLWKWKKEARVLREQEEAAEKQRIKEEHEKARRQLEEAEKKLKEAKDEASQEQTAAMAALDINELRRQEAEFAEKEAELEKREKLYPKWTSSNICHDAFSKTIIEKPKDTKKSELSEEEKQAEQLRFFKDNKPNLHKFGALQDDIDSETFLLEHPELVSEYTANYLVVRAVDLQIEEKYDEMRRCARQAVLMQMKIFDICSMASAHYIQFMMEIAKTAKSPPQVLITTYFARVKKNEEQYTTAFRDEVAGLIERVEKRAVERIQEAIQEQEEEERKQRIAASPGGLDPEEVFESLPASMKAAFEARDIEMLKTAVKDMSMDEAEYHIDRCTKSGLWVPGKDD